MNTTRRPEMHRSNAPRFVAAAAAVVTTVWLFSSVVALGDDSPTAVAHTLAQVAASAQGAEHVVSIASHEPELASASQLPRSFR